MDVGGKDNAVALMADFQAQTKIGNHIDKLITKLLIIIKRNTCKAFFLRVHWDRSTRFFQFFKKLGGSYRCIIFFTVRFGQLPFIFFKERNTLKIPTILGKIKDCIIIPIHHHIKSKGIRRYLIELTKIVHKLLYVKNSILFNNRITSYTAQVDYYTQYIKGNPERDFVKVYTDEGISGTNTKKRDGFNEMIADALAGKISLILTKSVSRFVRNTVDSLTTIRTLKAHGVEVFFEKENIWTFDSKGELLLTIMSSLAQEESRSISKNITWGKRKQFADGKVSLPYKQFLGYRKGANGLPEIVPEETEIVRLIYRMFIAGKTPCYIAKHLTESGIPTPGKKKTWQVSTVESILTNEKYKGEARIQKRFTTDYLTKTMKVNEGEVPQYYVENSHPAIIDPTEWEMVQGEFRRRKEANKRTMCQSPFSGKVFCGDCGD